ncbi:MAG: ABC transporter permease [Chloroflexales bacterium]|nr:ABC transporter permease [Chloroflexales bacterium]
MGKLVIRTLSFFTKEINEVRRQPRLVLSLLLGPFLILMLFGVGYRGGQPTMRAALVLPPGQEEALDPAYIRQLTGANFQLVSLDSDREQALARLEAGLVDVVQVFPADIEERVLRGEQAAVEFTYNEINPFNEQWIQYLAYAEVAEINRQILVRNAGALQGEAQAIGDQMAKVRAQLDALDAGLGGTDPTQLQESVRRLRQLSGALAVSALILRPGEGQVDGEEVRRDLLALQDDLDALDQAIGSGDLERQRERIRQTRDRIARLEGVAATLGALPPAVIVSPLLESYQNLNGAAYDPMVYYAPSVLAMLVQHIAVTLGSLSLVRERLLGATEIFQVAPLQLWNVIVGKYLGYTTFIALITAALAGLMVPLGVPVLGSAWAFAGLVLLLTLASLGVGFLISAVSRSESQAVQLSMLVLLLSIFFSGFFLPLQNFWEPVRVLGYGLPLTHGSQGLLDLMLRSRPPAAFTWAGLGIIAGVTFAGALVFEGRQFYRG